MLRSTALLLAAVFGLASANRRCSAHPSISFSGRMLMLRFLLSAAMLLAALAASHAAILTKCGGSKGYAYRFGSALVPSKDTGWQEELISKGNMQVIVDGQDFDMIYTD